MTGALLAACSSPGTGTSQGTGGKASTGGDTGEPSTSGGALGAGGISSGGSSASGGATGSGGTVASGGSSATGGTTSSGAGGTVATGGAKATGGAVASGGVAATGGVTGTGGTKATGGIIGSGGAASTGGTVGSGGAVATGGTAGSAGTGTDRCDVGVYDGATQPKVLTLSGNLGTHDPSAAIEDSGTYYLYYTGLEAKTSTDLTAWKAAAAPFGTPAWMTATITGVSNLWAPDVSNFGGTYHMYYAGSTFGKNTSCIGHATRASLGSGSWTDQGSATICSNVNTTDNWNAIDPSAILDTDGTPWLVFGSFWSGIKIIQLDQTGVRSATNTTIYGIAQHSTGIEGPFLVRRCGYYYLFVSWDTCCKGVDSTYKIAVGRSTSINSGFVDKMGAAMTSGAGFLLAQGDGTTFAGPGGQSVTIAGTKAYLIYHAYAIPGGASQLRIADLIWDSSGWPIPVGP